MITIKKGLDIPIEGAPDQTIDQAKPLAKVGVLGRDYTGLKPTMLVREGDQVQLGQPLFEDKKNPGVMITSPASGEVTAIHRGAKRSFLSLEIAVNDSEPKRFSQYTNDQIESLAQDEVRDFLLTTGLWASFRSRPFDKVPAVDATAAAVFVNAMDTHPLAPDVSKIIHAHQEAFAAGLHAVSKLSKGNTYVCAAPDAGLNVPEHIRHETFAGPHPAGLVGTHIHFLDPAGPDKTVWHVSAQDVIAIGYTLTNGVLYNRRVISLCGPEVTRPRLLETQMGADLEQLAEGELNGGEERLISGSALHGDVAHKPLNYLGRYHQQLTVLHEGREKEFLGWILPGAEKYSVTRAYSGHLGSLFGMVKKFRLSTSTNGSPRAMVPIGNYEKVMPLDILPTHLLRALIVGDTEMAQALGCLELAEEDLALCTFVCPGKYEYGPILRDNLNTIEKEG